MQKNRLLKSMGSLWPLGHKAVSAGLLSILLAGALLLLGHRATPAALTTLRATHLPAAPVALGLSTIPTVSEIRKYLVIGMGDDNHIDNGFQMSNSEIGADRNVLSNSENIWPPDITSSFPNIRGVYETRWNVALDPDALVDHDGVFEGIDWSGNVALTSDNSSFDSANSLVFGDLGIGTAASKSQFDSVDAQSKYFPLGNSSAPDPLLSNGTSNNNDFSALLSELGDWKSLIDGLSAEATISKAQIESDFVNNMASNGAGGLRTTYADNLDTNSDGIILVDVNPQDIDFNITNTDWVVNGTGNKLIIFRINDGANMVMNNVSITLGSGGIAELGAGLIFYQASETADSPESSDTIFSGNNVILDGGAFWDLNDVGESGSGSDGHNIVINNGQGCWQFVSQKVNFQNNRWNKCAYTVPPPVQLGDRVWLENDNDGIATGVTVPVVGHVITATSSTGVAYTSVTDNNGYYSIAVPRNDTYTVTTALPAGLLDTPTVGGNSGANPASNNDKNHDRTGTVVVMTTTHNLSIDFGFYPPEPLTSTVEGTVYIDKNLNGIYDNGTDTPIPDVDVVITATTGITYTVPTDTNGYYSHTVPAGITQVDVQESDPDFPSTGGLTRPDPNNTGDNQDPGSVNVPWQDVAVENTGYVMPDTDQDGIPDEIEGTGDRDNDGTPDLEDFDPQGHFYEDCTGQILAGGSVSVAGPGTVTLQKDGTDGEYQWWTDGTPGIYTMTLTYPPSYVASPTCLRQDPPAYDAPSGPTPVYLGNSQDDDGDSLTDSSCTPFYQTFSLDVGDAFIFNNNIPLACNPLTNSRVLTITKVVVGDPGGITNYSITVNGPNNYLTTTALVSGTPTVLTGLVNNGVYTVTETSPGAGWTTTYATSSNPTQVLTGRAVVTLTNASSITITNTAPPRYTLHKELNTPSSVRLGQNVIFTIRITNTGSSAIDVLPLRDLYDPSKLFYLGASPASVDSSNDGQVDWSDLTLSFGQNLLPNQSFAVQVTFYARSDTTSLSGGATINTAISPISPTYSVTAPVRIEAPTGIELASYSVHYDLDHRVTLAWSTASEAEVVGFHLLRRQPGDGDWVRLNAALIPAQAPGQATGGSYIFADGNVQFGRTYFYLVEMVDANGNSVRREIGLVVAGSRLLLPLVAR